MPGLSKSALEIGGSFLRIVDPGPKSLQRTRLVQTSFVNFGIGLSGSAISIPNQTPMLNAFNGILCR